MKSKNTFFLTNHSPFTRPEYQNEEEKSLLLSSGYMMAGNLTLQNKEEFVDSTNDYNAYENSSFLYPGSIANRNNESLIVNNEFRMLGYPSGYTTAEVYIISIATVIIMAAIVVGNLLVIIAIFFEYSLQCVQNWFVASLALADLAIGVLIMPFSLSQEVVGYWLFGEVWCQIHQALDVLLCTASILNITLISLDRYWSITSAIRLSLESPQFHKFFDKTFNAEAEIHIPIIIFYILIFLVCCISDRKICNINDLCGVVLECPSVIAYTSLSSMENSLQKTIKQQNSLSRTR